MKQNGFIELKRIAFRNLARHKLKTILTCAAIMVSVAAYVTMDGWLGGMFTESRRNIINYEMGAAKLQTKLYFENHDELPSYENFSNWEQYASALESSGYNAAPRYTFSGTLYSSQGSAPIVVNAVDPEAEARTLNYMSYIDSGRNIKNGEFGILLGSMTANKLGIKAGDDDVRIETVIDYKMESGEVEHVYQLIDAKVVGTVNSPDPVNNYNIAYIPLDVLQDEAGMMLEGHITELIIRDKKMTAADMTSKIETKEAIVAALAAPLAARGQTIHGELDVFQWEDYSKDYFGHESMEYGSTQIFAIILFFLAFIGISNTMLLAILERSKEIGMMRAMGMTDGQLVATYMLEAGFLGLIGSALGIVLSCIIIYPLVKYGVDFSAMIEQMGGNIGYRISGNARAAWRPTVIAGTGVVAVLLSALMALMPTRRSTKMAITDSLRFE
jgi:ABC-type lipoprotein release transport system permease subunit